MDPDEEQPTYTLKATPFHWTDLLLTGATLGKGIAEAFSSAWGYLDMALTAHALHVSEQQAFKTQTLKDIERIEHYNGDI